MSKSIRIGFLLNSTIVNSWEEFAIKDILSKPYVEISLVVINDSPKRRVLQKLHKINKLSWFIHETIDSLIFSSELNPFKNSLIYAARSSRDIDFACS